MQPVGAALDALAAIFTDERREFAARLLPVIAAYSELRERSVFKHIGLTQAMGEALEKSRVPELTASLAAGSARAFDRASSQWAVPPARRRCPTCAASPWMSSGPRRPRWAASPFPRADERCGGGELGEAQALQDGPAVGGRVDLQVAETPFPGQPGPVGDQRAEHVAAAPGRQGTAARQAG